MFYFEKQQAGYNTPGKEVDKVRIAAPNAIRYSAYISNVTSISKSS